MKNIGITVFLLDKEIFSYISDIVPDVGDSIEIPEWKQTESNSSSFNKKKVENPGIYRVSERLFIPNKNRVKLIVESNMI